MVVVDCLVCKNIILMGVIGGYGLNIWGIVLN